MAIFHLTMKPMARKSGRSVIGSIAYRMGEKLTNDRDGVTYNYSHREGVECATLVLLGERKESRAEFWNRVEAHHQRGPRCRGARSRSHFRPSSIAQSGGRWQRGMRGIYPHATAWPWTWRSIPAGEGDERNYHAHIVMTACRVEADGTLGRKVVELDPIHCQRHGMPTPADYERARWEELTNGALEQAQRPERIYHRSREAQRLRGPAQEKMGPAVTAIERRAQREARAEGRAYEPVTDRARERSRLLELRDVAVHQAQRAKEWLPEYGQGIARLAQSPFSQEALAGVGSREIERQAREREVQREQQARAELAREQALRQEQQRQQKQLEIDRERLIQRDWGPSLGREVERREVVVCGKAGFGPQ